jgi:hypothetical protein
VKLGVAGIRYEVVLDDGTVFDSFAWLPSPSVVQHAALATRQGARLLDVRDDRVVTERRRPMRVAPLVDPLDDVPALTVRAVRR